MPRKKATKTLTAHMVLDRSGSMASIKDDTIGAFNQYVETLAKDQPKTMFSLTIFDSQGIDTVIDNEPITKVKKLDGETYVPRASTPLYDAMGKVITKLDAAEGEAKALVVLTDGYENASREYTRDGIKKLLDEKQAKGWLVIYLGANQDALAEGAKFGTAMNNTMTFDQRSVATTLDSVSRATKSYFAAGGGSLGQAAASFTPAERKRAMGGEGWGGDISKAKHLTPDTGQWVKPSYEKAKDNPWLKSDAEA